MRVTFRGCDEHGLKPRPLDLDHSGERNTIQRAPPEIHAGYQHADAGAGFDRIQRGQGIFETDRLAAASRNAVGAGSRVANSL